MTKDELIRLIKDGNFNMHVLSDAIDSGIYTKKVRKELESYLMNHLQNRGIDEFSLHLAKYFRYYTNKVRGVLKDILLYNIRTGQATINDIVVAKTWGFYTDLHDTAVRVFENRKTEKLQHWKHEFYKRRK